MEAGAGMLVVETIAKVRRVYFALDWILGYWAASHQRETPSPLRRRSAPPAGPQDVRAAVARSAAALAARIERINGWLSSSAPLRRPCHPAAAAASTSYGRRKSVRVCGNPRAP